MNSLVVVVVFCFVFCFFEGLINGKSSDWSLVINFQGSQSSNYHFHVSPNWLLTKMSVDKSQAALKMSIPQTPFLAI